MIYRVPTNYRLFLNPLMRLLELTLDQRADLWVFLPRKQGRTRREAEL